MKTREQAFEVAGQALDLAQDLGYEMHLVNPEHLKRRYRWFANKTLLQEVISRQRRIEKMCKQAYELYNEISAWADEHPDEYAPQAPCPECDEVCSLEELAQWGMCHDCDNQLEYDKESN